MPAPSDSMLLSGGAGISLADAEEYFSQIFDTNYNYPYKKKFMTALKEAFERAFMELNDFIKLSAKDKSEIADKNQAEAKKDQANDSKQAADADKSTQTRTEKGDLIDVTPRSTISDKHMIKKNSESPDSPGKMTPRPSPLDAFKDKVVIGKNNADQIEKAANEIKKKDEKKNKKTKKGIENTKKIIWNGGMYVNQNIPHKNSTDFSDKRQKEVFDKNYSKYRWIREKESTKDFLTLLRKTVMAVLSNQGFITREIFVREGEEIAVILSLPEQNIKNIAVDIGIVKPLEMSMVDLVSLEPVDTKYRPLRLSINLWDQETWEKEYTDGKEQNEIEDITRLRKDIIDLLQNDCNMCKIVRMCNGIWQEEGHAKYSSIHSHAYVALSEWYLYRSFLVELAIRINFIKLNEKKFKSTVDIYYEVNKKVITKGNTLRKTLDLQDIHKFTCREVSKAFEVAKENANNKVHLASEADLDDDEEDEYEEDVDTKQVLHQEIKKKKAAEKKRKMLMKKKIEEAKKAGIDFALKGKLKNIWDYMGINTPEHMANFMDANSKMRPRTREFFNAIWKESISYVEVFSKDNPTGKLSSSPAGHKRRNKSSIEYTKTIVDTKTASNQKVAKICYNQFTKVDQLKSVHYLVGYY